MPTTESLGFNTCLFTLTGNKASRQTRELATGDKALSVSKVVQKLRKEDSSSSHFIRSGECMRMGRLRG